MGERLGGWMRRLARELIRGTTLIGASLSCGGEIRSLLTGDADVAAHAADPPRPLSEAEVRGEVASGVRAIEHYLAAHDRLRP